MRAQSLEEFALAADNETKLQEPPKKRRKHIHAASSHTRVDSEPASNAPSALSRPRSQSPPASSSVSPSPSRSAPHVQDHRVFLEILNDSLHERNEKRIGKVITDERFDRLVRACGLPLNDPSVTKGEREAIAHNKYVAGVDGRLFAWKPGHEKDDIATGTWPTDMYEVVRFSDIFRVIQSEHVRLGGAKSGALYLSLQRKYKGITRNMCQDFCKLCACCANSKVDHQKRKKSKIRAIIAKHAWFKITFDLICMVTTPGGEEGEWLYIFTAIDHFSKYAYAWPLKAKTAEAVESELRRVFMMFGVPVTCQADNGSEFKGLVAELMKEKEVVYTHGQPYKPQTQGVIERFNQTIQQKLNSIMIQKGEKDWYKILDQAVISYNNTPHSTIKETPYKIMFGMDPPARFVTTSAVEQKDQVEVEVEVEMDGKGGDIIDLTSCMSDVTLSEPPHVAIRARAHSTYVAQAQKMVNQHNKKTSQISTFAVGQYVSVTIEMGDHPNRLPHRNIGGVIIQITKHNSYRILTAYGMISSPLQPQQFIVATPAQYPEMYQHAHKWSSDEECERTVQSEKGYTMIEIHTKICSETGITARLEHCKKKQKERKQLAKDQAKKQGVKHPRARAQEETRNEDDSKGSDDDVDADDAVDVNAPPVGYAIPERILDERVYCGMKQYRITWLNLPESKDSWELASEYDDGAFNGAYIDLVQEWEEYKPTDPQYAAPTTTPPQAPPAKCTRRTNKRKSTRKPA